MNVQHFDLIDGKVTEALYTFEGKSCCSRMAGWLTVSQVENKLAYIRAQCLMNSQKGK